MDPEDFENILYIWEFFNNFADFLSVPYNFTIAELQAALNFTLPEERVHTAFYQDVDSSQEFTNDPFQGYTWHQRCSITEIKERGIHLINQLHIALAKAIAGDLDILNGTVEPTAGAANINTRKGGPSGILGGAQSIPLDNENGLLIHSIMKLDEDPENLWTEMIRLLLVHSDERHNIDLESSAESVQMAELLEQVGALTPNEYTWSLTYKEKVDLLLFLIDTIHDLDSFRQFITKRLDSKADLFKQKSDLLYEMKKIEQEKQEAVTIFNNENQQEDEAAQTEREIQEL